MARALVERKSPMSGVRVAILACTNVIGGHEFQTAALGRSLAEHVAVTVFVNRSEHAKIFQDSGLHVCIADGLLLGPGALHRQGLNGWRHRARIRAIVESFDHVIVSAGAVEAGVSAGIALRGFKRSFMYLPFFYDRVPVWGWKGHLYNWVLALTCKLFDHIITINRIQAWVIYKFTGVPTIIVANKIRHVQMPVEQGPSRLVFVGRLDHQKRIDELMRWLDIESTPIKELLLIGEGPLRPLLEQMAQNLTYLNCTFLGWMGPGDQDRMIRKNDILVLNSLLEGEPLVIREARSRGMNIVARDIIGTRGVTTRSERFSSQNELIDKLAEISNKSNLISLVPSMKNPSWSYINRKKGIMKLLEVIENDCI
jgi:glycosyltransferase involved in cell wall biosynthesis